MTNFPKRTSLAIAVALALYGCGGSDGTVSTVSTTTFSGPVVDGYIAGATVFHDVNNDGILNPGETSTLTDSLGNYKLELLGESVTFDSTHLVIKGGTDASTGLPFTHTMSARIADGDRSYMPITPLTTLVSAMVASGTSASDASNAIAKVFGLSSSAVIDKNPLAQVVTEPSLLQKMVALQKGMEILASAEKSGSETNSGAAAMNRSAAAVGAEIMRLANAPAGTAQPPAATVITGAVANQGQKFQNLVKVQNTALLAADVASLTEVTLAASVTDLLAKADRKNTTLESDLVYYADLRLKAIATLQAPAVAAASGMSSLPVAAADINRLSNVATSNGSWATLKDLVAITSALNTVPNSSSTPGKALAALQVAVNAMSPLPTPPVVTPPVVTPPVVTPPVVTPPVVTPPVVTPPVVTPPVTDPVVTPPVSAPRLITSDSTINSLSGISSLVYPAGFAVSVVNSSTTDGVVVIRASNGSTGTLIETTVTTSFDASIFSKASFATVTGVSIITK